MTELAATNRISGIAPSLLRWRSWWLTIHRWLGLTVGLVAAIIGLTGAALVFVQPIARMENGPLLFPANVTPSNASKASVGEWVANARARFPELHEISEIGIPGASIVPSSVPVIVGHPKALPGSREEHWVVPIDPVSGQPLGLVIAEETWWGFLLFLHAELLLPYQGTLIVATAGVIVLISLVTGIYLWWPRDRRFAQAMKYIPKARGRGRWFNLHNIFGMWLIPFIAVAIGTGVLFAEPFYLSPVLDIFSKKREPDWSLSSKSPSLSCPTVLATDKAIAVARAGHKELAFRYMSPAHAAGDVNFISLYSPGSDPRAFETEVFVDRYCPTIVFTRDGKSLNGREALSAIIRPLHVDLQLGVFGKIMVFLGGVALPALFATGVAMWVLGRKRQRKARARSIQQATTGT